MSVQEGAKAQAEPSLSRLAIYLNELRSQCVIAEQATNDMVNLLLNAHVDTLFGGYSAQSIRFWYALQSFLTAAANISKLLWPAPSPKRRSSGPDSSARGDELRRLLAVEDKSQLKARTLRNDVEHLDRHLDELAALVDATEDPALCVRVIYAGPPATFGINPDRCFMYFDASTHSVTFAGQAFPLMPISHDVYALHERINAHLDMPSAPNPGETV